MSPVLLRGAFFPAMPDSSSVVRHYMCCSLHGIASSASDVLGFPGQDGREGAVGRPRPPGHTGFVLRPTLPQVQPVEVLALLVGQERMSAMNSMSCIPCSRGLLLVTESSSRGSCQRRCAGSCEAEGRVSNTGCAWCRLQKDPMNTIWGQWPLQLFLSNILLALFCLD